ncbi:MAG: hypothetical protein V1761_01820, partial [bacterium]
MFATYRNRYASILADLLADRNGKAAQAARQAASEDPEAKAFLILALTADGDPDAALAELATIPEPRSALVWIAAGNLHQTCGWLSEAFSDYEIGLRMAHAAGSQDLVIYGRIWRNLALSRFGDHTGLVDLESIVESMRRSGQTELEQLAMAVACLAAKLIGKAIPDAYVAMINGEVAPGLRALALGCQPSSGNVSSDDDRSGEIKSLMQRCEGVQGDVITVAASLPAILTAATSEWIKRHVRPLERFIAIDDARIFPALPDEPLMQALDCARCDGRCCYDGVYVTTTEEARIRPFMKEHPEYFRHVPEEFLEDGEWGFLFGGKRTVRRLHRYERTDFPRHFTQTKCVFALANGECSLQRAATDLWLHPWKFKPELCWEFPLIGLFNDNAMEKPHYFGEPDPGYYDDEHPGYVSFLPCSRIDPNGHTWKKMYKTEFLHYFKIKGVGR